MQPVLSIINLHSSDPLLRSHRTIQLPSSERPKLVSNPMLKGCFFLLFPSLFPPETVSVFIFLCFCLFYFYFFRFAKTRRRPVRNSKMAGGIMRSGYVLKFRALFNLTSLPPSLLFSLDRTRIANQNLNDGTNNQSVIEVKSE